MIMTVHPRKIRGSVGRLRWISHRMLSEGLFPRRTDVYMYVCVYIYIYNVYVC